MKNTQLLQYALREDFRLFIHKAFHFLNPGNDFQDNWHIDAVIHALLRVRSGHTRRLLITLPPRSLKSHIITICFPLWLMGHNPNLKVITSTYGSDLSEKFGRDSLTILESEWFQKTFPAVRLSRRKKAASEFETTQKGFRLNTSVGGSLTGRGGDLIILDDVHKPNEITSDVSREQVIEWYKNTLLSRFDNPSEGAVIVVMQRLHEEDLAGHLIEHGDFEHLNLPAISTETQTIPLHPRGSHRFKEGDFLHEARLSAEILDSIKSSLGSSLYSAQYLQTPYPRESDILTWGWFRTYDSVEDLEFEKIVQSWDTAVKDGAHNDYSVCTTWGVIGKNCYLIDLFRRKMKIPELVRNVKSQASRSKANLVLIEDAASGSYIIEDCEDDLLDINCHVRGIKPTTNKIVRFENATPMIEAGKIHIPEYAEWMLRFKRELMAFPNVKHDDQVDSVSQFINWKHENRYDPSPRIRRL